LAAFCYLLLPELFSDFPPSLSTVLSSALAGLASTFFHSTASSLFLFSSANPSNSDLIDPALIA
jgi:hypothetical protein